MPDLGLIIFFAYLLGCTFFAGYCYAKLYELLVISETKFDFGLLLFFSITFWPIFLLVIIVCKCFCK